MTITSPQFDNIEIVSQVPTQIGTLGDCLQQTAYHTPKGYTLITGTTDSSCGDIPARGSGKPTIVLKAATAAMDPAPVTIHILAGTDPAAARKILKLAANWLKHFGNTLPDVTPGNFDNMDDDLPF